MKKWSIFGIITLTLGTVIWWYLSLTHHQALVENIANMESEEFKSYIHENYQEWKKQDYELAKDICWGLWAKMEQIENKIKTYAQHLKRKRRVEYQAPKRNKRIAKITRLLQTNPDFSQDHQQVTQLHDQALEQLQKRKKTNQRLQQELQVLHKVRSQNQQQMNEMAAEIKQNKQQIKQYTTQYTFYSKNKSLLEELAKLKKLEAAQPQRQQAIHRLRETIQQKEVEIAKYRSRISTLERVCGFYFKKERAAWETRLMFYLLIPALLVAALFLAMIYL